MIRARIAKLAGSVCAIGLAQASGATFDADPTWVKPTPFLCGELSHVIGEDSAMLVGPMITDEALETERESLEESVGLVVVPDRVGTARRTEGP